MGIRVPMYTPEVQAQAAPIVRMGNLPDNGMGAVAQGIGNVGNALSNIDKMQQDFNKQADSLAAEEKLQILESTATDLTVGSDTTQGYRAKMGKNVLPDYNGGVSLTGDYMGRISKVQEELSGQLKNEQQKEMFRLRSAVITNNFQRGVQTHQMQQAQENSQQVIHTVLKASGFNASLNWDDPSAITSYLARVDGVIASAGVAGMAGVTADQLRHDAISDIHHGVMIGALAAGQTDYAANYLKQNAKALNTNQLLDIQSKLNQGAMDNAVVAGVDAMTREFAPKALPDNFSRLMGAAGPFVDSEELPPGLMKSVKKTESGSLGQNAISVKGAVGDNQVMPKTAEAASKALGIPYDRALLGENSDKGRAYNLKLAEYVMKENLHRYGGDVGKAVAAYNGGWKRLDAAVESAKADGSGNWLKYMKPETQAYVPKVLGGYQQGTTTQTMPSLMEFKARGRQIAERIAPGNGAVALRIDTQSEQLYANFEKTKRDDGERAYSDAMKIIGSHNGDVGAVPPDVMVRVPGEKLPSLYSWAKTLSSGEDVKTAPALYAKLSNDDVLGKLSDQEMNNLSTQLSPGDFKHFISEKKRIQTGSGGNAITDVNGTEIKRVLSNRLPAFGVDPTPKGDDVPAQAKVGVITQHMTNAIRDAQIVKGSKLTEKETEQVIDKQFATPLFVQSMWSKLTSWTGRDATGSSKPLVTASIGDLDSKVVDAIKADFVKNGMTDPTDAQIMSVYLETKRRFNGGK